MICELKYLFVFYDVENMAVDFYIVNMTWLEGVLCNKMCIFAPTTLLKSTKIGSNMSSFRFYVIWSIYLYSRMGKMWV